jgi:phosphotransferase family enzyme
MLARNLSRPATSRFRRRPDHASRRPPVRASSEFPDDAALPALGAIRAAGLARAIPRLGLPDSPVELILRAYKPGARATFEARVASRRFAVKAHASGADSEAALYDALHAAGLAALPPRPARARATQSPPSLVHGTLYARHLLDLGDGPGVIDWQRFGQGPLELDAGTFLATVWRSGLRDERLASEATLAEEAFVARTAGLLNACAVAWYRAAVLLRLACKCVRRRSDWLAHGHALLREAMRQTEATG